MCFTRVQTDLMRMGSEIVLNTDETQSPVAHRLERRPYKTRVEGSIPSRATIQAGVAKSGYTHQT